MTRDKLLTLMVPLILSTAALALLFALLGASPSIALARTTGEPAGSASGARVEASERTSAAAPAAPLIDDHLLLSEANMRPSEHEFIEIVNPTGAAVSLDDYYLSDDDDYAYLPGKYGAGPAPSIGNLDFIVQFPAGSTIPAGGLVVVAFDGAGFLASFGFAADFEILGLDSGTPDMVAHELGINASLVNGGESAVLFYWDGVSDLVADVDMVNLGIPLPNNDIGDKTGVSVDGPDADTTLSTYLPDAWTMPPEAFDVAAGLSTKRVMLEGVYEVSGGGNGITGDDETTEVITITWDNPPFGACNPGFSALTPPLLSVAKTASPAANVAYHGAVTYTVVLRNSGASDRNVALTDTLPISTTFTSWLDWPAGAVVSGNEITWSGTVTASEAMTFSFAVIHTGEYGDVVTNTAEYRGTATSGSDEAAFTVVGPPDYKVFLPIVLRNQG